MLCLFYFFKQKTAYEMRISDWSSDVCSSDLMTLADARACHPGLVAMERDEAADRHWLERMGQDCIRYTPHVMLAPPDGIGLDITGATHLFGGERPMVDQALDPFMALGMTVPTACGSSLDAARALARHDSSPVAGEPAAIRASPANERSQFT